MSVIFCAIIYYYLPVLVQNNDHKSPGMLLAVWVNRHARD